MSNIKPIIAIDGPAGAGKSTVARIIAEKLGLVYIDTGSMYRSVTLMSIKKSLNLPEDTEKLIELTNNIELQLFPAESIDGSADKFQKVVLNGEEVTKEIRTKEVTKKVSDVSAIPEIRKKLVELQQQMGKAGGVIMDGRDIGSTVFPNADLKVFLVASSHQRAVRRQKQLSSLGINKDSSTQSNSQEELNSIKEEIERRDEIDSTRKVSPLRKADDAVLVDTDNLSIDEVVEMITDLVMKAKN